ncbi:response regulator, partial [Arthrobacter sp. H5]|uniref:LytR/AlgR family response regulator transcription factor n=1 Tax=Arthrobacter sp. H5 TaxID=1267973 RepID=UPI00055E5916
MVNVVIADDELPAIEELAYLLSQDARIDTIHRASNGAEALRALETHPVDALFLDIHMPSLSGLDIARVISRFSRPPAVVFVTADEDRALEAFELRAVDYLLKPVRTERLAESVRRIC